MKYVSTKESEYLLDDGERIKDLGKCKLKEAKKEAKNSAKKTEKPVFILKTVGYIDPEG
ncbi:MAG: hypothetical protein V5A68_06485 [Candidatus Thermoplasmatota archaeon]